MLAVIRWLSLAVLLVVPVAAEQHRGHIRGTVLNPDGSPAARVSLIIVSEADGETRTFVSGPGGRYTLAALRPGTYRIHTADGFEPRLMVRAELSIAQDLELDLHLGLDSIAATADVRPTFVPADRHSAAIRTRVAPSFIATLPLDGRDVLDLVLLAPGLQPDDRALASNGTPGAFSSYFTDGSYNTEARLGVPAARVQIDTIDELDVRTATFDALSGRSAGAQVAMITKAGTNRLTGGALGLFAPSSERVQLGGFAGGPLKADRTFLFGNYQLTESADDRPDLEGHHLLAFRADHIFDRSARLTGRYALEDGGAFDRRGQNAAVSLHTPFGTSFTNEVRFGLARVSFADIANLPIADSRNHQLANLTTWWTGQHLVTAGIEWNGFEEGVNAGARSASTWGLSVQDDWRVLPTVAVNAGVRFDHASPGETENTDDVDGISPRLGVAWTLDRDARTVLRGGYGIYRNVAAIDRVIPRVDGWSVAVQRHVGRARTLEAAYVGSRGDDLLGGLGSSRYDALQLQLEQRSELGISALVGYTYGEWTEAPDESGESVRSPFDSRHRLSAAFVAALPFGDEQRWFSSGLAATILGNMELSGILTFQSGRPVPSPFDRERPAHRNADLALLKYISLGDRMLQLRLEAFNVTDRENLERGRRYQLGGRFGF